MHTASFCLSVSSSTRRFEAFPKLASSVTLSLLLISYCLLLNFQIVVWRLRRSESTCHQENRPDARNNSPARRRSTYMIRCLVRHWTKPDRSSRMSSGERAKIWASRTFADCCSVDLLLFTLAIETILASICLKKSLAAKDHFTR